LKTTLTEELDYKPNPACAAESGARNALFVHFVQTAALARAGVYFIL
jgi:hypothetical protein